MPCRVLTSFLATAIAGSALAFEIKTPQSTGLSVNVDHHNKQELRSGFRLAMSKDISSIAERDLIAFLKSLDLKTLSGRSVRSLLLRKPSGLAIGVSDDAATINLITKNKAITGETFIVSVSDQHGLRITDPSNIGVFDYSGKPKGFTAVPFALADSQVMRVELLLDISGSMKNAMPTLKRASIVWLEKLSKINQGILCRITVFNSTHRHLSGFEPCETLTEKLHGLKSTGGTDLQSPLLAAYTDLGKYKDPASILIITDGNAPTAIDKLLKKKTANTHALWLGNSYSHRGKYQELVETNLYRTGDVGDLATSFYDGFVRSVRGQIVITIPSIPNAN